ncbi:MAG: SDR family oxidoreductase [Bdellovibrionota bacterium]
MTCKRAKGEEWDSKVSVFGSTGFIGSEFCRLSSLPTVSIPKKERVPRSEQILYLISTTHNQNIFSDLTLDYQTNIGVLLEALSEFRETGGVFNFVSSWFVYGNCALPAKEESACQPRGFYSMTKRTAEQLLITYCETFGLAYRIFRLSNVIGPTDRWSKEKNALQYLISEMAHDRDITLSAGGNFFRDYLHVEDVVRALDLCLLSAPLNSIINIGSGKRYLFRNLIDMAHMQLKSKSRIIESADDKVTDSYLDVSKIRALGFEPSRSIESSITEICNCERKLKAG